MCETRALAYLTIATSDPDRWRTLDFDVLDLRFSSPTSIAQAMRIAVWRWAYDRLAAYPAPPPSSV